MGWRLGRSPIYPPRCATSAQLRRRVGSRAKLFAVTLFTSTVQLRLHSSCGDVATATSEKGQLTSVSCFTQPHTPCKSRNVLKPKREHRPEVQNAGFSPHQRCAALAIDYPRGLPRGTQKSMKSAPVQRSVQRDAHEVRKVRQKCAQVHQRCAQGLPNGAKMEVRDPPESVPNRDRAQNGGICDPCIIYYVSATSAGPGNLNFGTVFRSKE